jgi:gliding motility-associated-like protein
MNFRKIFQTASAAAIMFTVNNAGAQNRFAAEQALSYRFSQDSLSGFDEEAAKRSAIDEHFTGAEFPVRMFQLKRQFINNKYNLIPVRAVQESYADVLARTAVVPACTNEDFEASTAGIITASNQIAGWTVTRGSNNPSLPGQNGYNSCNLNGCCPSAPVESELIVAPSGLIDPVIGSCYPIYSVFGTNPGATAGATTNSHLPMATRGDAFIRINSSNNNYSIERLSKTFSVTPNSALFQFAFIAVFSTGHGCCDAGAFQIRLFAGCNNPTLITCPNFTASALSSACINTVTTINWLVANPTGTSGCTPASLSSGRIFNKWQIASMDLSGYIGNCITIEVVATDCTASGHYGYVYFDAQCGPMTITGNGTPFPAGTASMIVPTCGAAGATMCATPGIGSYAWAGPNVPQSYSTLSPTNQCYTSSLSATYTLTMQPPGGCPPIVKVITTTITPAPLLVSSAMQATCGQTLAVVSVTPGGSAGSPASITWWPPPFSLSGQSTTAQYVIPTGPAPTVVSVTASDPLGCLITTTQNVMPAAPFPHYTVNNLSNTYTISCYTPSITLDISTTYTYGNLNYFWASNSFTSGSSNITVFNGGSYTVTATDNVSQCATIKVINIGTNTLAPASVLSPTFQSINCNTPVQSVTVSATPSVNITHYILSPLGGSFVASSYSTVYTPGYPGTYTYAVMNDANGCVTVKQFTVASSQGFPTFTLTSTPGGYTLGCNTKSTTVINIANGNTSPPGGAVSYTILPPGASSVTPSGSLSVISTYTLSAPGSYTVITKDNVSFCETRIPISILSNTFAPGIDSVVVPSYVLTCRQPTQTLRGISFSPNVGYNWAFTGFPGNVAGDTLNVSAEFATPTNTVVDNFTLTVTDLSSTCKSTTVIAIRQNLFPPKAIITNGGTSSLTCITPTIMLSNSSSSGIPPNTFPPAGVNAILWQGPSPQLPLENSSTYLALYAGNFTMTAMENANGCTSKTIIPLYENRIYPLVNNPVGPPTPSLDCGATFVKMSPVISTQTNNLKYEWTSPPTATVTGANTATLTTNMVGEYVVRVTNTVNGCSTDADMTVVNGKLVANFEASLEQGYAPLTVNFENKSTSSLGSSSITAVWNFGNGKTTTLSSVAPASVVYNQPGTYTVTMYVAKGSCLEILSKVIQVDIPSQVVIPNVFTPNGDGVNDLFILQRANNLSEVSIRIFDRWGEIVYELENTDKGQIEWDGNNQYGKPVPDGTYFYILTATGRDGANYDKKGSISLLR